MLNTDCGGLKNNNNGRRKSATQTVRRMETEIKYSSIVLFPFLNIVRRGVAIPFSVFPILYYLSADNREFFYCVCNFPSDDYRNWSSWLYIMSPEHEFGYQSAVDKLSCAG